MLLAALFLSLAPPVKFDALVYHLLLPDAYLRAGSVEYLPWIMKTGMPQTAEMLYTWAMALSGTAGAATLGWVVGIVTIVGMLGYLSQRLGAKPAWVGAAALLAGFSMPVAISWAYVDWWCLLFGLGALVSLDQWRRFGGIRSLLVAGLMAGFALRNEISCRGPRACGGRSFDLAYLAAGEIISFAEYGCLESVAFLHLCRGLSRIWSRPGTRFILCSSNPAQWMPSGMECTRWFHLTEHGKTWFFCLSGPLIWVMKAQMDMAQPLGLYCWAWELLPGWDGGSIHRTSGHPLKMRLSLRSSVWLFGLSAINSVVSSFNPGFIFRSFPPLSFWLPQGTVR
jgi:hypothetical protein